MSWETQFTDLMPHTVTMRARASRNSDGSDTFSTSASTYRARVMNTRKWVRGVNGNGAMTAAIAWIASTGTMAMDSRYTLPDGSSPPVLMIDTVPDEDGVFHNRVTFAGN